ncbi:MAG: c-type cytochrome [Sphingobacteriales bacterium]|nr:c-type cytochrome [Sphingobacteriales bacterium]
MNFQKKPWPVPDTAKNKKNPVVSNAESIAAGKALWSTHCKSCHGAKGLGDGPKAAQLNTEPGDFSKTDVQAQTDGSLFYKTSQGRDDMPGYKSKIPDQNDIWSLVNYIRTLKKGGATAPVVPVVKDTVKKVDQPVKVETPPAKKDTVIKKNDPVIPKTENIPLQEQINILRARVDSLEKEMHKLKEKISTMKKDSVSYN